jgi:hypothetical protein
MRRGVRREVAEVWGWVFMFRFLEIVSYRRVENRGKGGTLFVGRTLIWGELRLFLARVIGLARGGGSLGGSRASGRFTGSKGIYRQE